MSLKANEPVDSYGNTLLHLAVMKNDVELMKNLLKQGYDVRKKNKFGESPLSLAVEYDSDLTLYIEKNDEVKK